MAPSARPVVAIDVTPLAPPQTGIGQFVAHLLHELGLLEPPVPVLPYLLSRRAAVTVPGLRRLPIPAGLGRRLWARSDHPNCQRWLGEADVVHATNYVAPPTHRPTIVSVHDLSPFGDPSQVQPGLRSVAAIVRRAVDRGAWIHTISEHIGAQARELLGTDRVVTVPLAGAELAPATGPPLPGIDQRPYVLALGRRERRKNLPRLVAAFGLAHEHLPDLSLVLAGPPGDDQEQIDAAIAALPRAAAEHVLITDWLEPGQRTTALRGARVLAYPSLDEGFGLPMLEAMRAGVPVVAACAGAIPEVAGDAAVLVDPTDVEQLAAELVRVVDDEALRRSLIERGHAQALAFTWQRTASAMADLYERAATEARR